MGPGNTSRYDLPSCPRFAWDMRNCPWTDGKGNKEQYVLSVNRWSKYHDVLTDVNGNKTPVALRGLTLQAQLFV